MTKDEIRDFVAKTMNELLPLVMRGTFEVFWSKYKHNGDGGPMSIRIEHNNNHVELILYQDLLKEFKRRPKSQVRRDHGIRRYVTHELGHITLERICHNLDGLVEKAASDIGNILMQLHEAYQEAEEKK